LPRWVVKIVLNQSGFSQEELIEAMNVFDKEGTGYLEKEVLEAAIQNMGDGLTPDEIQV
jgi:Ca2+-binding EF-hand superfamily protein